jgi:putative ABC transport system permease protein
MTFLTQDVAYAVRQLRKTAGFTFSTVITLALGIGANLTVFLILYGVLLRPLPFPHPEQLVRIERSYPNGVIAPVYTATEALFLRRTTHTFSTAAVYDYIPANINLVQSGEAIPLKALRASEDFFAVFAIDPAIGRGFNARDMIPNAPGVVVISDALWRERFSADPGILGHTIILGNRPFSIIGVARPEFRLDARVDVWTPLSITESPKDQSHQFNFVARLRPGVTRVQAQADLKNALLQLKTTYPELWDQYESNLALDLHDSLTGDIRPALEILMGAVALVLVIVSANILCLLLTRSIARRREMSLRAALGATAWRILRQLLVENAILCLVGGAAGVFLAGVAAPALMHLSPLQLPDYVGLEIGAPALTFAAVLTFVCALIFSLVPAFESRSTRLNQSLRVNTTQVTSSRHIAQKILVISEVAVSLVLMVAAALLLTSFWKLMHTPSGFDSHNVVTFKNAFSDQQVESTALLNQRLDQLTTRLEALPGVARAAAVSNLPTQLVADLPFDIIGRAKDRKDASGDEKYVAITEHYFDALHVPLIAGRIYNRSDSHGSAPVLIVNQQFVRNWFPGQNPIGQHVQIGAMMGPGFEDPVREIVGVVGDVKQTGLDAATPAIMYLPSGQIPDQLTKMMNGLMGMSWVVRTQSPNVEVATPARLIFMDNAQTPLLSVEPLAQVISTSIAQQRFSMILLSAFGMISLVLGAAGLYGVLSFAVARQTQEIGVRMAVGAQRSDIVRMVLRNASQLIFIGLGIGVIASLAAAHLLQSLVFGIAPRNPFALAAMSCLLLGTGLFAAWWPARRAAATEPMQALRSE